MENPLHPIVGPTIATLIMGVLQLGASALLKRKPEFPNAFIPWLNLIVGLIGFSVVPVVANAGDGNPIVGAVAVGGAAILQTLLVTGAHSFWKNAVLEGLLAVLARLSGAPPRR